MVVFLLFSVVLGDISDGFCLVVFDCVFNLFLKNVSTLCL